MISTLYEKYLLNIKNYFLNNNIQYYMIIYIHSQELIFILFNSSILATNNLQGNTRTIYFSISSNSYLLQYAVIKKDCPQVNLPEGSLENR